MSSILPHSPVVIAKLEAELKASGKLNTFRTEKKLKPRTNRVSFQAPR